MTMDYKASASQRLKWASVPIMLVAMVFMAGWGIYTLPAPIVDGMLEADIRKQSEMWKRRVLLHMEDAESSFQTGLMEDQDRDFLELMPDASDVYRLKLFKGDGTVFWSTRPSDIGSTNTKRYFAESLASGEIYYKQDVKPASEIDDLILHSAQLDTSKPHNVAEIYTPVMRNSSFLGAIEFYTDITELRGIFILRVRVLLGALSGIALTVMVIVSLVVYRSNRRQLQSLRNRSQTERDLMDEQLRLAREVRLLGELNEWLQSSRSLDELFEMVAKFMTHILPEAEGSVYVYSNSRDVLDGSASWNGGTHKDHIHPDGCWGLRRGRTYEYGATEVDFVCEHAEPHDGRPYFCFPILAHGETVGLMHLRAQHDSEGLLTQNKKLAQMCAEQISMAIANVQMRDQLHDQSVRDPLTGLFNRRHMTDQLRKFISLSQASGAPVSLIAVDVDHFKKFNDNHGHDAGDMVLRAVGSVLQQSCDGDEIACRMGGEEFTLILPGSSPSDVQNRAEKLRKSVEDIAVRYGEKTLPRITISLGIAHYPTHGTMPQDLMRAADDALYDAKARGRNQVRLAALPHQAEDTRDSAKHPSIAAE